MLTTLIKHDLKVTFRRKGAVGDLLVFFVIIISLFPLSLGAEPEFLQKIGSGIIWVAALLVSTLSLTRILEEDFESGILEQLILQPALPHIIILAKTVSHWISSGLPIVIISPFLGMMFGAESSALTISLLLGTPILSLIGTTGAALTLGIKRGGILSSLLVMPLYVPTLIFGTGMVSAAAFGLTSTQFLSNAAGLAFTFLLLAPLTIWASAQSLKIALEQ